MIGQNAYRVLLMITKACNSAWQIMLQVIVTDTAGMRETLDPIEAEGVAVAQETAQQADVLLSVLDCATWLEGHSDTAPFFSSVNSGLNNGKSSKAGLLSHPTTITVFNKADTLTHQQQEQLQTQQQQQQQSYTMHELEQQPQLTQMSQRTYPDQHTRQTLIDTLQQQQQPPSTVSQPTVTSHPQQSMSAAVEQTGQAQGTRAVMCSCKTGWNMETLVSVMEQGVLGVMQSGQEAEEALIITRFWLRTLCLTKLYLLSCIVQAA